MAKLVVLSRYLKSGDSAKKMNLIKYIATREGTVNTPQVAEENANLKASIRQEELIDSLLKEFSDVKEYHEYEDYINNPTKQNASELISEVIERNLDQIDEKSNYIDYLANRPGAVKNGSHGLFSQTDEPIVLDKVANEVAYHKGNVWTHVISLKRENAEQMGYNNLNAWRELIKRQVPNIAKAHKIDLKNLNWYAAYHEKVNNPHVHVVVYSDDNKEGYLTQQAIKSIKSGFANDIYTDEMHHLYGEQTLVRDTLKLETANQMQILINQLNSSDLSTPQLEENIEKLRNQLNEVKGKKVYGYLPPKVKDTVDEIYSEVAKNEVVSEMYDKWCNLQQEIHNTYSNAKVEFPDLIDNKEFRSVKNMIISEVANINLSVNDMENNEQNDSEIIDFEKIDYQEPLTDISEPFEPSDEDLRTLEEADYQEPPTDMFEPFQPSDEDLQTLEEVDYQETPTNMFKPFKLSEYPEYVDNFEFSDPPEDVVLFGVNSDSVKTELYYEKELQGLLNCKMDENIAYKIGMMYLKGQGTEIDLVKAEKHLLFAEEKENYKACSGLGQLYIKLEDYEKAEKYLLKAAEQNNHFAQYALGKFYLDETHQDNAKAEQFLLKAAEQNNQFAQYALGKFYLDEPYQDIAKAEQFLLKAAEQNNQFAQYALGKFYLDEQHQDIDKAEQFFLKSAKQNNQHAQYALGRFYLDEPHQDFYKAQHFLTKAAEQNNQFAQYALGKFYLDVSHQNFALSELYLREASNQDNHYAQYALGELYETLQEPEKAQMLYKEAFQGFMNCEMDEHIAYKIGIMYLKGQGTKFNLVKAKKHLLKAAALDNQHAQYKLGKIYADKELKPRKALKWFEASAKQGNIFAKYQTGKLLLTNAKVKDRFKGVSILASISKENVQAASLLGKAFMEGELVPKNYSLAERYLTMAYNYIDKITNEENPNKPYIAYSLAKLNLEKYNYNPEKAVTHLQSVIDSKSELEETAKYKLADLLINDDVVKNVDLGIEMMSELSHVNSYAGYALGKMYLEGTDDIEQNKELAVKFLTLSAEQGNEYAEHLLEYAENPDIYLPSIFSIFGHVTKMIREDYNDKWSSHIKNVDHKIRIDTLEKKQQLGMKQSFDME